jgi:hypothetical protein
MQVGFQIMNSTVGLVPRKGWSADRSHGIQENEDASKRRAAALRRRKRRVNLRGQRQMRRSSKSGLILQEELCSTVDGETGLESKGMETKLIMMDSDSAPGIGIISGISVECSLPRGTVNNDIVLVISWPAW